MIGLDGLISILADTFFAGDIGLASMMVYLGTLMVIFALFAKENLMIAFILMLPITVMFNTMATLPDALTIMMIIIALVGLMIAIKDKVV